MEAIRAHDLAATVRALDEGCDVDEADIHGHRGLPLRTACFEGETAIVEELLRRGADINAPGADGHGMPIRLAARFKHRTIVEMLIAQGAEIPHGVSIDLPSPLIENFDLAADATPPAIIEEKVELAPLDIPLDDLAEPVAIEASPPSCPAIEKVEVKGCYGVDTNILNEDLLRLEEAPSSGTSRRNRSDL